MRRLPYTNDIARSFEANGAETLVVFVHGLGGTNGESYWGRLPTLLASDTQLGSCNLAFWGFATSKKLYPNWFSIVSRRRAVPNVIELSEALQSYVEGERRRRGYKKIILFGHSLGGHIVVKAAETLSGRTDQPIKAICIAGSPLARHLLARIHNALGLRSNPQIRYLADRKRIEATLTNGISTLRQTGTHVTYIHGILDELLDPKERGVIERMSGNVDSACSVAMPHHWFLEIKDRFNSGYCRIRDWIKEHN